MQVALALPVPPESLLIVSSCAWSPCLGLAQGDSVAETTGGQQMFEDHIIGYTNTLQHLAKAKPVHPLRTRRTSSEAVPLHIGGIRAWDCLTREGTLRDRSQWQRPEGGQIIKTQVPSAGHCLRLSAKWMWERAMEQWSQCW